MEIVLFDNEGEGKLPASELPWATDKKVFTFMISLNEISSLSLSLLFI
jgi:hypothetical protein